MVFGDLIHFGLGHNHFVLLVASGLVVMPARTGLASLDSPIHRFVTAIFMLGDAHHTWLLTHHVLVVVCEGLASKRVAMPLSSRGEE